MPARTLFTARAIVAAAIIAAAIVPAAIVAPRAAPAAEAPDPLRHFEGEYVASNFHFVSGETLPELRMHYTMLGKPHRDAHGHVDNAVLILHGTGGSGHNFLTEKFSGVLFGKGQLLDTTRYFIILPDGIGHGQSSRRLVLGTSMGCMHTWMWGESHSDFVDALMPLACLPVPIAGRNRVWRDLIIDAIRSDPEWRQGEYRTQPAGALRTAAGLLLIAGSAPIQMQLALPTPDAADQFVQKYMERELQDLDANDFLYQVSASRDYDPSVGLENIRAPVMWVNSADDFINPPELAIAEREIKRVPKGRFVLLPASDQTHGHGTHTWAAVWQQYLGQLLESSKP
jgi:homoserine O-acetyltransferase